ncbi:cytochrome-c peroxidase [Solimonas marina]|uniref:C-type cytochrome n=1 Tax=Solimonas marina TaxID=2714601 RepID=A0A969WAR4_9GAMM|nr:cytochrome c peroxidase [Solimonas marina]NKF23083.1 c-type cytochrome [Solimonas marina]
MRLRNAQGAGLVPALCFLLSLVACQRHDADGAPAPAPDARSATHPDRAALAALGRTLFFDPALSASGRLACATCHDPAHAYAPADGRVLERGGPGLEQSGLRAVPSLRYDLARVPHWAQEYQSSAVERMTDRDNQPVGGYTWDGRYDSLAAQAAFPLLAPNEMANHDAATVAAAIRRAPYASRFTALFGTGALDDATQTLAAAGRALARFELDDPSFHPYSSRFDAFLDGKATLNDAEQRGYALFVDPNKGNCASCHIATPGADGSHPLFTDFSFHVLGVPRNARIAANVDAHYYDLGLCGPIRSDQTQRRDYCGMFRTPSLRNVATRAAFFHNGAIRSLRDAVAFYATRDSDPGRWYPEHDGKVERYDDLPVALRDNVDIVNVPFAGQRRHGATLNDAEVDDIVAFLKTLSDADVARAAP